MATLKSRAQHKLFAMREKVRLDPLSIGDAYSVALTVMRSLCPQLLRAAEESKKAKKTAPTHDVATFTSTVLSVIEHRDGSIYAAFVTAVDSKRIFHGDRFAVSLARLGITDELQSKLHTNGFPDIAEIVAYKAPWFWAQYTAQELLTVRNEVSTVVTRVISRFTESITTEDINELLEAQLFPQVGVTNSYRVKLATAADALDVTGSPEAAYLHLFRQLARSPRVVLLDQSSSLDGVFETFHQHLMTDVVALQRLLPGAKFGGKQITPSKLQQMFKDPQFTRRLKQAFENAYDVTQHDISMDKLYRSMQKYSVYTELARAARVKANIKLDSSAVDAIVGGIVGLFFAFAGDMKGQSFPLMKTFKG